MNHLPGDKDLLLLNAYLDGEMNPAEAAAFEQRLAAEELLQRELEELQATIALLRMAERIPVPRSFTLDPAVYGKLRPSGIFSQLNLLFTGNLRPVLAGASLFVSLLVCVTLLLLAPDMTMRSSAPGAVVSEKVADDNAAAAEPELALEAPMAAGAADMPMEEAAAPQEADAEMMSDEPAAEPADADAVSGTMPPPGENAESLPDLAMPTGEPLPTAASTDTPARSQENGVEEEVPQYEADIPEPGDAGDGVYDAAAPEDEQSTVMLTEDTEPSIPGFPTRLVALIVLGTAAILFAGFGLFLLIRKPQQ